jgi:GDPmannose 4,6-dehydratase
MWLMLQQDEPDDYVLATGETHTVRDLAAQAFTYIDLNWEQHVVTDERFYRAAEIHELKGDASKARDTLGWQPTVVFEDLVARMMTHDIEATHKARMS